MLRPDIQVLDFTARDWLRLSDIFRPEPSSRAEPSSGSVERAGVMAVRSGDRVVKLLSFKRGRLPLPAADEPASAKALASANDATFALVASQTALEQLGDRFARRLERGQLFHAQLEAFVAALRELELEGELELWPTPFRDWPVPTERALGSALELLCPEGKVVVVGAFDGGELYTAAALRRAGTGVDFVLGPDRLREDMGLLSGDFSRDYRYLGGAVEARLGPVAVGCYAELRTFRTLSRSSEPGAWARAVAARDVVLTPVTRGVALPLGVDAGRAALALAQKLAQRFGGFERFSGGFERFGAPPLAPAFERAYAFVEGDLRRYLGFDPWRLLVSFFRVEA